MNQPPTSAFSKLPIVGTWPVSIQRQATSTVCATNPPATIFSPKETAPSFLKTWP